MEQKTEPRGASMVWSDTMRTLTAGFDLHTNQDEKYGSIYDHGERLAQGQRLQAGGERLWLLVPNAVSEGRFTITNDQTWNGGWCEVNAGTIGACRRALELAARLRGGGTH